MTVPAKMPARPVPNLRCRRAGLYCLPAAEALGWLHWPGSQEFNMALTGHIVTPYYNEHIVHQP
jgi:hypothetical protein